MIKRTLFFSNPAYLSTQDEQLIVNFPSGEDEKSIPIEDLGYLVLEHPQITLTNGLLMKLVENKTAVITCDRQHLPISLLQPLVGHTEQTQRVRKQIAASLPLKKQLWQQTVMAKIDNQANLLLKYEKHGLKLKRYVKEVKSGDSENHEAIAAAHYFQQLFGHVQHFNRTRNGVAPNNLLNYGYAILRATTARAIVASGLFPSLGIHHKNKYNAFCLADDLMEPFRPFVDEIVFQMLENGWKIDELSTEIKSELLRIPAMDVKLAGKKSPLMNAMSRSSNSLVESFMGTRRTLLFPVLE